MADNLILEELKKISRRLDTNEAKLDTLNNDRSLYEDILSRLTMVENALELNKAHQAEVKKDIRADIKQSQFATEDKVDDIKKMFNEKTLIIKTPSSSMFNRIKQKLLRGGEKNGNSNNS